MKGFWKGYGDRAADMAKRMPVSQEKAPAEFILHRNRLYKALVYGMILAALLPSIASIDLLRNSILNLSFISDIVRQISYFKSICTVPKFTDVLKLWYLVMYAYCFAFLLYAVIFYPYRTLILMCRRIQRIKDHLIGLGGSVLCSLLIYGLMINPLRRCEEGTLILGHGNLILHSMTTTYIGLSLFGPLIWAFSVLTWASTIFMVMTVFVRCFTSKT